MRPRDLDVLGFPKVLEALAALAVSGPGAELCLEKTPLATRVAAERALDRQWSFFRLLEVSGPLPLTSFRRYSGLSTSRHSGLPCRTPAAVVPRTLRAPLG